MPLLVSTVCRNLNWQPSNKKVNFSLSGPIIVRACLCCLKHQIKLMVLCFKVRHSSLHENIAKWHLFQTDRKLLCTVSSREEFLPQKAQIHSEESNVTENPALYPPHDLGLKQMAQYILQNKKIPAVLPDNIRAPSLSKKYPKYLCPEETMYQRCPGAVLLSDPILITKRAIILSNWCIVEGRMVLLICTCAMQLHCLLI